MVAAVADGVAADVAVADGIVDADGTEIPTVDQCSNSRNHFHYYHCLHSSPRHH